MNRSFINKVLALVAITAIPAFAADSDAQIRNLDNRVTALEQRKGSGGVILPAAGPNLDNDIGISLGADFLLWKAHLTDTTYAVAQNQNIAIGNTIFTPTETKELHAKFRPGVRATLGVRPCHDDWQIDAVWTHLYTKASGQTAVSGTNRLDFAPNASYATSFYLRNKFQTAGTFNQSANAAWRVNYNTIDLNVSRPFYVSKWLSVRPVLGLRNLWLRQKYNINFTNIANATYNTVTIEQKNSNQFWGMGPQAGLNTLWGIGRGISIFGDASASLLWGFTKDSSQVFVPQATNVAYLSSTDSQHFSAPATDLSIGLAYDHNFYDNQFHFGVKAGWEHHAVWDAAASYGTYTMQGFTLAFAFDF